MMGEIFMFLIPAVIAFAVIMLVIRKIFGR